MADLLLKLVLANCEIDIGVILEWALAEPGTLSLPDCLRTLMQHSDGISGAEFCVSLFNYVRAEADRLFDAAQREAEPYSTSKKANADRMHAERSFSKADSQVDSKNSLGSRTALCEGSPGALDPISFPTLSAASSIVVIQLQNAVQLVIFAQVLESPGLSCNLSA